MSRFVQRESNDIVVDLKGVFKILLKRLPVILLIGILGGAIAFAIARFFITPQYKASVTLYVKNSKDYNESTTVSPNDLTASAKLVDTFSAIITSKSMYQLVTTYCQIDDINYQMYMNQLEIKAVNDTQVFTVSMTDPNPNTAQNIVNGIAEMLPGKIGGLIEGCSVSTVDLADLPTEIASPNSRLWIGVGFIVGLLLAVIVVTVIAANDQRIRSENDLSEWDYPVLSVIPDLSRKANKNDSVNDYQHRGSDYYANK